MIEPLSEEEKSWIAVPPGTSCGCCDCPECYMSWASIEQVMEQREKNKPLRVCCNELSICAEHGKRYWRIGQLVWFRG